MSDYSSASGGFGTRATSVKMIVWWVIVVLGVLLAACIAFYFLQPKLIFHPTREFVVTPDQLELPFEDVYINVAAGERVHGWYFRTDNPNTNSQVPVVLFCHGNAGNISHRLETAELILSLGARILLFDYRGYGKSDGSPSEENVYADAEACYNWLVEQKGVRPEQIILFGRSLGGAITIELARRVKCRALVVESSFTSVERMARKIFPLFTVKHILRYKFDSIRKIGSLTCPVLVMHSPDDELIPFEMGQRLFAAANEPKRFVSFRSRHNEREYLNETSYQAAWHDLTYSR